MSKSPLLTTGSVSRRLINRFSNRRNHLFHRRPVLAGFESGSNGGNGGKPLRGIVIEGCVVAVDEALLVVGVLLVDIRLTDHLA